VEPLAGDVEDIALDARLAGLGWRRTFVTGAAQSLAFAVYFSIAGPSALVLVYREHPARVPRLPNAELQLTEFTAVGVAGRSTWPVSVA
jgi:hypothetical protein